MEPLQAEEQQEQLRIFDRIQMTVQTSNLNPKISHLPQSVLQSCWDYNIRGFKGLQNIQKILSTSIFLFKY